MESFVIYLPIVLSIVGLLYMLVKRAWVMKQDAGDGKMKEISDHIYQGALAFLNAEYRLLAIFVFAASIVLAGVSFMVPSTHILIVVAFFRELLGSGKLFGFQVIPDFIYEMGYVNNGLMLLSPMALITVGIFIWIQRSRNRKLIEKN